MSQDGCRDWHLACSGIMNKLNVRVLELRAPRLFRPLLELQRGDHFVHRDGADPIDDAAL